MILVCGEDGALKAGPSTGPVCVLETGPSCLSLPVYLLIFTVEMGFALPLWMVGLTPRLPGRSGGGHAGCGLALFQPARGMRIPTSTLVMGPARPVAPLLLPQAPPQPS